MSLLYYDANGKRVPEGSPDAKRQYTSDDETRPDAKAKTAVTETTDDAEVKAVKVPPEDKAVKGSANK